MIRRLLQFIALLVLLPAARAAEVPVYFDSSEWTTKADLNVWPRRTNSELGHTVTQINPLQGPRFRGSMPAVKILSRVTYLSTRTYRLYQDGVSIAEVELSDPGDTWKTVTLKTGLTGSHVYEIQCISRPFSGAAGSWYDAAIVIESGTLEPLGLPARKKVAFIGDSTAGDLPNGYNTGTGSGLIADGSLSYVALACRAADCLPYIVGSPGGRTSAIAAATGSIPVDSAVVFVVTLRNDGAYLPGEQSAVTSSYVTLATGVRSQIGAGKPIFFLQAFEVVGTDSQRPLMLTIAQNATAGMSNTTVVNTTGWCPTTTTYMPDNTHHNIAGNAALAPNVTAILNGLAGGSATATTLVATNVSIGTP